MLRRSDVSRVVFVGIVSGPDPHPKIAVVVATKDRSKILATRALSSIAAQTRAPDYLVVVDDSSAELRLTNKKLVDGLNLPGCTTSYLENDRTPGASGSWNTALAFLLAQTSDPGQVFVAVLDDDDTWDHSYLDRCLTSSIEQHLDMVAADIRRVDDAGRVPLINEAPTALRADDFLTSNPGIQGSNLFVRFSVLLAAGGFDEALRSTTDRDLCIRIADLEFVRFGRLPLVLVDHFTDPDRVRLSTRGSAAKQEGLTAFWRKYRGRMSAEQRRAFQERAERLFDWRQPSCAPRTLVRPDESSNVTLVLGVIVDNERPCGVLNMAQRLSTHRHDLAGLEFVLVEDGDRAQTPSWIEALTSSLRDEGMGCFHFTREKQSEISSDLSLSVKPRTSRHEVLNVCCARVASGRACVEVWVMDTFEQNDKVDLDTDIQDVLRRMGASRLTPHDKTKHTESLASGSLDILDSWIRDERVATAAHRIMRRFSPGQLRVLGRGSEAVVFTDDFTVYKCFDGWKTRVSRSKLDFLRRQVGRWGGFAGLHELRAVVEGNFWAALTYDYEDSSPFEGGHEDSLVRLLDSCAVAGVVCNNVHPKNLTVTSTGVKLIDYGADIHPLSELGFEHMARRTYLACKHAMHPSLELFMRQALRDVEMPQLDGYNLFRARLMKPTPSFASGIISRAPSHQPFSLYVGVITSDPVMLESFLYGLQSLRECASVQRLVTLVLDNGCPATQLERVVAQGQQAGLCVAVVSESRQRADAARGAFGFGLRTRPPGQVSIASARTMLQQYLGSLLERDPGSFGWVLDDDMRVDRRAIAYLSWLPAFREQGVDVLLGAYEGSSPNPPLNGFRIHLVDLLHNLVWLRGLSPTVPLPDRSLENAALRKKYPDYYYDLSRKHTGHLEMPHWLEPACDGELVARAYTRLITEAHGVLSGAPLTRPIRPEMPVDPLVEARNSVNRGGTTFILNPRALTHTPNSITRFHGREVRRSDMIWAIVNRYYRGMTIKAVGFPIHHVGRVTDSPCFGAEKVEDEIIGSALYAGLTEFLRREPRHDLGFSALEAEEIHLLAKEHLKRRLLALEQSFHRIVGLRETLRSVANPGELDTLLGHLDDWFTQEAFQRLRSRVSMNRVADTITFLTSLRALADDFASATVDTDFIAAQLRPMLSMFARSPDLNLVRADSNKGNQ